MLCVLTTDAVAGVATLNAALRDATRLTFDRLDSDGCLSTNDTVLLLASGASEVAPTPENLGAAVLEVCADLARQLVADAEGASKDIAIEVRGAKTEDEAVDVARAVSRSNLLKCALHGEDPNWGRILAAVGTTTAEFDPLTLDAAINGVWVCRDSAPAADPATVDLSAREIQLTVDLKAGSESATVWSNDLTAEYVHENSAYST
jgi:glutamate N-acetyltransferase/amino-acid N-acetyltransferase